jgi:hypothetical protein
MTQTFKEAMEEVKLQVSEHLPQCCEELLHQHDTGILIDGYVRDIAAKLLPFKAGPHLSIVQSVVYSQAIHRVVDLNKSLEE